MESASSVVELEASQSDSKQIENSLVNLELNIDDHHMKSAWYLSDDENGDIVSALYEKSNPASSSPNQLTSMMNSRQQVFTPLTQKDKHASTIFQGLSLPSDALPTLSTEGLTLEDFNRIVSQVNSQFRSRLLSSFISSLFLILLSFNHTLLFFNFSF